MGARRNTAADIHRLGTARMEIGIRSADRADLETGCRVADQEVRALIRRQYGLKQSLRIGMPRMLQHLLGRPEFNKRPRYITPMRSAMNSTTA